MITSFIYLFTSRQQRCKMTDLALDRNHFPYRADGKGILYFLGKEAGKGEYANPYKTGTCNVRVSGLTVGCLENFVLYSDRVITASEAKLVTGNILGSWIEVELPVAVRPEGYQLTHGAGRVSDFLRNWCLCGLQQKDGKDVWVVIFEHKSDTSFDASRASQKKQWRAGWKLNRIREAFSKFRLVSTGKNSSNNYSMTGVQFEIFGTLHI